MSPSYTHNVSQLYIQCLPVLHTMFPVLCTMSQCLPFLYNVSQFYVQCLPILCTMSQSVNVSHFYVQCLPVLYMYNVSPFYVQCLPVLHTMSSHYVSQFYVRLPILRTSPSSMHNVSPFYVQCLPVLRTSRSSTYNVSQLDYVQCLPVLRTMSPVIIMSPSTFGFLL